MKNTLSETMLPNGMKIFYLQKREVSILYEQIQEYFKNGIEVHPGDIVFDVGANIGMFSLWVYQLCKKNVTVYAFEPIPAIFEVLQRNVQRFNPENLKVLPHGLARESKTMTFSYHLNAPAMSTAYPNSSKERDLFKESVLRNFKDAPLVFRPLRWLPPFLRSLIVDHELTKAYQVEQVTCQLRTLSEIIREHNIQRIDLLKVDVEKSELDVLLGIEEQDWPKIKQVVVEVHNIDHQVEKITALLKEHGLDKITVDQEPLFKDSQIFFNVYALRKSV